MDESAEQLERRIAALRAEVRRATRDGDRERARVLRADLRAAEEVWDELLETDATDETEEPEETENTSPLLPLREQVHEALSLLTVPATPKLIATVHEAFFTTTFASSKLTSMKRDEERSFRLAPFARPYYICAALTADRLTPSRGLLAVSTWPTERRLIGPLSPRTDFLTSAIRVAEAIERLPGPSATANRLLYRFSRNIPGAPIHPATLDPRSVIEAAQAELSVHEQLDAATRADAAVRARQQLDDAEQLFGATRFGATHQGNQQGNEQGNQQDNRRDSDEDRRRSG